MSPNVLLQSALTFRECDERSSPVPPTFDSISSARDLFVDVVLHEAHVAMSQPLDARPEHPYMHPVDVDTEDPGIVDRKLNICRTHISQVARLQYRTAAPPPTVVEGDTTSSKVFSVSERVAATKAEKSEHSHVAKAERMADTVRRRDEHAAEKKRMLSEETPEQKETRLREAREKREQRRVARESTPPPAVEPNPHPRPAATTPIPSTLEMDTSARVMTRKAPKRSRGSEKYFEHPLPNHRTLEGLHKCAPNPALSAALLSCDACEGVELIQGPPGTGKTTALVERLTHVTEGRVYACAPSNVGAANLYERCVAAGLGDQCALMLVPDRVPPGVAVLSNDPRRRILCGTVSSRCGPMLNDTQFSSIFLDEAAQCAEASVWTLLREEVTLLVMAGDVRQLSCICSETGRELRHDRSLMERLLDARYDNVRYLTVQNRMAPEILRLANDLIYDGTLTCGPAAPARGRVELRLLPDGREEADGTSYRNACEVDAAVDVIRNAKGGEGGEGGKGGDIVFLCPYVSQCKLFLTRGTGCPVHTIDSFQGREADTVVLSMVRDGTGNTLGFWSDMRRVCVAITRARTRLVILASNVSTWPHHPMRGILQGGTE